LHTDHDEKSAAVPDAALLSNFFHELNVFHKNASAYPPQHPMIKAGSERVMSALDRILASRDEFSVIVTRTALFAGKNCLDPSNRVFRTFAEKLFYRGVATMTFEKGLEGEELGVFNEIINLDREKIREKGGLERILADRGVRRLRLQSIDYGSFSATEKEELQALDKAMTDAQSADLWVRFFHRLSNGFPGRSLQQHTADGKLRPEALARLMNESFRGGVEEAGQIFGQAVGYFMTNLQEVCNPAERLQFVSNFAALVRDLNPELCGQFVKHVCDYADEREVVAGEILESFPGEVIKPLLADISSGEEIVSPPVFRILRKIQGNVASTGENPQASDSPDIAKEKLDALNIALQKDNSEQYVPDEYREQLRIIMPGYKLSDRTRQDLEEMKHTLSGHFLEHGTSLVILELLNTPLDDRQSEQLAGNLLDLCTYFLGMGDFASLLTIYDRLCKAKTRSGSNDDTGFNRITDTYSQHDFLEEVLNGLTFWGKAKYGDIRKLIGKVGKPFASPLLDRLADEQNISMRRCYMECLAEMGEAALDEALSRLRDGRWYFVRNVLILLRGMNDPSIPTNVRPLTRYPHAKVRQEAFRTLMHFNDQEAERLLLQDMSSDDRNTCLDAIKLAEKSSSPEIFETLLGFLDKSSFTHLAFDIKTAAVQTLAEIGNPDALPALEKLLRSRNLLHPRKQGRLKHEIVRSLGRYPVSSASAPLQAIARSSRGKLAKAATEVLGNLRDCT
jgi:hypothetical protein